MTVSLFTKYTVNLIISKKVIILNKGMWYASFIECIVFIVCYVVQSTHSCYLFLKQSYAFFNLLFHIVIKEVSFFNLVITFPPPMKSRSCRSLPLLYVKILNVCMFWTCSFVIVFSLDSSNLLKMFASGHLNVNSSRRADHLLV